MASLHGARIPPKAVASDVDLASIVSKPSATAEQLDSLYFREREVSKNGQAELNENAIYELSQLDASLEELFRESHVDFVTHQQIHKYRLRVSRRIAAFAGILRRLLKHSEATTPSNRLKLQSLHRFYMERLMRHKNKLSDWWSRNERRYHSMCLSSFVSEAAASTEVDGDENELVDDGLVLDSGEGVDSELVLKLKATRSMMLNQINQMSATESSMLKSSSYIVRHEEILNVLKKRFGTASQMFKSVRRQTLNRYGTVRMCYFAFLGACGFITLRRFRVFKLVIGMTRLVLSPAFFVARLFYRKADHS